MDFSDAYLSSSTRYSARHSAACNFSLEIDSCVEKYHHCDFACMIACNTRTRLQVSMSTASESSAWTTFFRCRLYFQTSQRPLVSTSIFIVFIRPFHSEFHSKSTGSPVLLRRLRFAVSRHLRLHGLSFWAAFRHCCLLTSQSI